MGMPMWPQWANANKNADLQTKLVSTNIIWSESAQRLLSYGTRKVLAGRPHEWMNRQIDEPRDAKNYILPLFSFRKGGRQ